MVMSERLARIQIEFKRFRIPHPRLLTVRERIDTMRAVARMSRRNAAEVGGHANPMPHMFLPIIAPSGSGKSTCIIDYLENVLGQEKLEKGQRPLMHVTLSAQATTKRLGSDILEAFEDPDFEQGVAEHLLRRAYNHLELAQTEVLVLDELQHLIRTDTTRATAWSVTETIKRMLIRGVCPMILMGTQEARAVLLTNPQMKSRCLEPIFLDPLDISLPNERDMFLEHCVGVDLKMVEHGIFTERSNLLSGDIPQCLYDVSQGVIGIVSNLVMNAALIATMASRRHIERDDLDQATQRWAIPTEVTDYNPFRNGARELKLRKVA
jgi:hypothetical protein